jgi:hypothetical protein
MMPCSAGCSHFFRMLCIYYVILYALSAYLNAHLWCVLLSACNCILQLLACVSLCMFLVHVSCECLWCMFLAHVHGVHVR